MKAGFEEKFSSLQSDMVNICLENVQGRANNIYIYCYHNDNHIFCNYFYKIKGKLVKKHKLNEAISFWEKKYDVSIDRQKQVTNILLDDLRKIKQLCDEYEHPMPIIIKLNCTISKPKHYSLKADYEYEVNKTEISPAELSEEWFSNL